MSQLGSLIKKLSHDVESIPKERMDRLNLLSRHILDRINKNDQCNLLVVCTHNSRRSQLTELWLNALIQKNNLTTLQAYSCGTEVTEFHPNMVNAAMNAGFLLHKTTHCANPIYRMDTAQSNSKAIIFFSKALNHASLPKDNVIAVMVCDHAEKNCPMIQGCDVRFSLPYSDPKRFDGQPVATERYMEKVEEVGVEMIYLINQVKSQLQH